jgi:hypothetical protein
MSDREDDEALERERKAQEDQKYVIRPTYKNRYSFTRVWQVVRVAGHSDGPGAL